ncbi:flagellar transcriptional regulator FlhD [Microbulbifer magnicolonia]|uniref:flagellar transcriptional regulator FlhD n=1 Tax=Microbulbifer magnicolonia TaxID=3109744 RepID=UPI002B411F4C|nr:flagellar transcriptional regulator FlhD [Microbulbifer sp. GG15]
MKTESIIDEIQDINLTYLLLAQRLLKEDHTTAMFRLKIDQPMAKVLASLTAKQLTKLARTNQFLFRLHLDDADQLCKLTGNTRVGGLGQIHTALLMSSRTA